MRHLALLQIPALYLQSYSVPKGLQQQRPSDVKVNGATPNTHIMDGIVHVICHSVSGVSRTTLDTKCDAISAVTFILFHHGP